jgi:23S rRNA (adenine2503-C2)-methyltransferase
MKQAIISMSLPEFQSVLTEEFGEQKFRAKQIFDWIYKGASFAEMSNLPKSLRQRLDENFTASDLDIVQKLVENKTNTIKYLLKTKDDIIIECVVLSYEYGNTICISTQAGCSMHCAFCVSGKDGLIRNLTSSEMMSQLICSVADTKQPIGHIVMMGSGEPLDNYDQVADFITRVNAPTTFHIGIRNITLSTCGIIPGIEKLMQDKLFINLSVSMHAPFSDMRQAMMPVERAYPIREVIRICEQYRKESGRRITYEYSVIPSVNDTDACADELQRLLKGSDAHINLIGLNEGSEVYAASEESAVTAFGKKLTQRKLNATVRRKLGSSINAACGQLKSRYIDQSTK